MVSRPKHCTINMRSNNAAKLSTCVGQANTDTSCDCALEGSDTFRPNNRVCRSGAGYGDDETDVFDYWVWYCYEDNIADNDC
jgi:hypothetical protein